MKRLLILLSTFTLSTTISTNVISCKEKNKYDKKNDGNSVLYYLPGSGEISLKDGWDSSGLNGDDITKIPGSIKMSITQDVMRIFNVAALAMIGDNSVTPANPYNSSTAFFPEIPSIFKDDYNTLTAEVNEHVKEEKKSQGKNWNQFLKDNYNGSEDQYKGYLYQQGDQTDSSSSMLATTLLNNYQADFDYDKTILGSKILNYFENEKNGLINWIKYGGNVNEWTYDSKEDMGTIWNKIAFATGNWNKDLTTFKNNIGDDIKNSPSTTNKYNSILAVWSGGKQQYLTIKPTDKTLVPKINSSDKNKYAIDYSNIASNNLKGFFSSSQQFIEDYWYAAEKPLAVSQIIFKYGNDKGGAKYDYSKDKLTNKKMTDLFTDDTIKNIEKVCSGQLEWSNLMNEFKNAPSPDENTVAEYEKNLLTVDANSDSDTGFATDAFKNIVYGSLYPLANQYPSGVTDPRNITADVGKFNPIKTISPTNNKTISDLNLENDAGIKMVDNTSNIDLNATDMFQIYSGKNDNIIAYFDSIGLHIVHIDGVHNLNDNQEGLNDSTTDTIKSYTADQQYQDMNAYKLYTNKNINYDKDPKEPNTLAPTNYLKWLNNNQYNATNPNLTTYSYDIQSALTSFATFDPSKTQIDNSSKMWFWVYDYIKYYLAGQNNTISKGDDWVNKLLKFTDESQIATNIKDIFNTEIRSSDRSLIALWQTNMIKTINNINNAKNKGPNGKIPDNYLNSNYDLWVNQFWDTRPKINSGGIN